MAHSIDSVSTRGFYGTVISRMVSVCTRGFYDELEEVIAGASGSVFQPSAGGSVVQPSMSGSVEQPNVKGTVKKQ